MTKKIMDQSRCYLQLRIHSKDFTEPYVKVTLSNLSNAMLVRDGYVVAVIKKIRFLYLFDSHARNSLGIHGENGTAVYTLRYTV